MEDDFEVEMSALSQELTAEGIYRGDTGGWILEVIDESGVSTVWEDEFDTEEAALDEVKATIRDEGIDSLIGMDV